jgi:hypothetical protein
VSVVIQPTAFIFVMSMTSAASGMPFAQNCEGGERKGGSTMKSLGIALIIYGLLGILACAAWLSWMIVVEPEISDAVAGFLSTIGMWTGLLLAAFGIVLVVKHRGGWVPPL